jgi:hypothetical protein
MVTRIAELGTTLAASIANFSVVTRATQPIIPEDGIIQSKQ